MGYFHEVKEQFASKIWVNNPNMDEMNKGIEAGVCGVTTNPAYCSKLLKSDHDYLIDVIDNVIDYEKDDDKAADLIYQITCKRIMDRYAHMYEASEGKAGYVTIQFDPRKDRSAENIIAGIKRHAKTAPNYMAKIPVTEAGLIAIEEALRMGLPVCATEVFAVAQAKAACEVYEKVAKETGKRGPMYVTHISGIFEDYLTRKAQLQGLDIDINIIKKAGSAVSRREYYMMKENGYSVEMMGGGARGPHHFTDLVGGDLTVTLNWSTIAEILEAGTLPESKIAQAADPEVIRQLSEAFPEFRQAYEPDGLKPEEFETFGPVELFRNSFIEGYNILLKEISSRRIALLR